MSDLFVLGNGESRKDIDVDLLKTKGKVYGCNAMYREHKLDGLIAVDPMLEHEIYRSGYCDENKVYFRDWENMPNEHYEMNGNIHQKTGMLILLYTVNQQ